jgi:antitoxin (DNA-binding transcriptional repressor) of toxin-antitoxin stability system
VEGSLEEVLSLVRRCTEYVATVAPRVSVVVKLDVRPSVTDALHAKVATVERHLGNPGIPARELRNDVSGELHRVEHGDIEAVRAGERLVLTVHGEAIVGIVTHAGRSRWIPGDLMRRGLAERTADTALPDDLDELAGQTLDQL